MKLELDRAAALQTMFRALVMPGARSAAFVKAAAEDFGWDYHEFPGDLSLLERFVAGNWNEEDFLVLEPGETAVQSVDDRILKKK